MTNPPGLASISYRVDSFGGFRRALLRPLPGERAIGDWRPASGDLGLQVLEWWAYVADVLTFYNERHANEAYLRTAKRPTSLAKLVAQLGYAPRPAIAAAGHVAAVRRPGRPGEPLVIPAGTQLASVASAGVASQTFEVDETMTFTGPSTLPVTLAPDARLAPGADGSLAVLLAGRVSGLRQGEELLLVTDDFDGTFDGWTAVTVAGIAPAPDPAGGPVDTLVTLRPPATGWQSEWWLGYLLGARDDGRTYRLLRASATAALWQPSQGTKPTSAASFGGSSEDGAIPVTVNLSATLRGLAPGDLVLFDGPNGGALGRLKSSADAVGTMANPNNPPSGTAAAQPALVVPFTQLSVDMWWWSAWVLLFAADLGSPGALAVRYGFREVGQIVGVPAAQLSTLPATVTVPEAGAPVVGATALLEDATGVGVPVLVTGVAAGAPGMRELTLAGAGDPPAVLARPLAVPLALLVDLVPVSRGRTSAGEVLGSGNAALANQTFALGKSPLTYLSGPHGARSTLVVDVDGLRWEEVASFYGQSPDARVYVVVRAPDGTASITFGDGIEGARLPSGSGNVVASYRYGSGAASPPAGRLTTVLRPQPNLARIENPVAVGGGADPPPTDAVREDAPASVVTFGRAISATDYELIASQAPGVARATAYWTFDGRAQRTLVAVYVGDDEGAVAAAATALAGAEDPNRPIVVRAATPVQMSVVGTLLVDASHESDTVIAAATAALAGLFGSARMGIGQPLYRSAVAAALLVPGVTAVRPLYIRSSEQEVFDPGEGGFFVLRDGDIALTGVSADG